jgi:catechol 2,3-dioxygenase-like lactoylglutathione lyase family enzyme
VTGHDAPPPRSAPGTIRASMTLVSIFCTDHRALATWYAATFGFPEIESLSSPLFTALAAGGVALGFHHDDAYDLLDLGGERAPVGTRLHCTFAAGDAAEIDAAAGRLRAAGARLIKEPFDTYYGARQIVFADPEGNVMRLSTPQPELSLLATGSAA